MQFNSDFFNSFNAAFDNLSQGSGAVVANGSGTQGAVASGSGNQNAFASGNNAFASAVSGTGMPCILVCNLLIIEVCM